MNKDEITSAMIKELRDRTNVGMSKCKDALVRANGSVDKAIEILRKEGMASAVKKEGRETKEGFIDFSETDDAISIVELNCETDFVAQNNAFKVFLSDLAAQAAQSKASSVSELSSQKFITDKTVTVEQFRNLLVQKFGENIQIRKVERIHKKPHASYGTYSHMGGKILTIVEIDGAKDVKDLAREVAMHVAAEAPEYLSSHDVPPVVIEKEKEIARSLIKNKPENVIEKIVEGKVAAYYKDVCLEDQPYVKDPSQSVKQFVNGFGIKANKKLSLSHFWYFKIGQ